MQVGNTDLVMAGVKILVINLTMLHLFLYLASLGCSIVSFVYLEDH